MPVKNGDKVKIEYEGKLDDGTVFDSSEKHGQPLEFEVGAKQVIKGFEDAVMGMEKGQEKEVRLEPEQAYGSHNPELIKEVPKDNLNPDVKVEKGTILAVGLPNGQQIPAKVAEVGEKTLKIDLNHPLAGSALNFKVKVVDVSSA